MTEFQIKKFITDKRFSVYDDMETYGSNLKKSKQMYIPLSILEVSLRNSINNAFEKFYTAGWLINEAHFLHQKELEKLFHAKNKLRERGEEITKEKLIAELTFGFWTGLFKTLYDQQMRFGTLRQIFPNLPPKNEKIINRKILSSKLNHIREFRNRIFHHENILKPKYDAIEEDINEILEYLDKDLKVFAQGLNDE